MKEKCKKLFIIFAAAVGVYALIRYALPLLLPFLLGYFICGLLYPAAAGIADSRHYPQKIPKGLVFAIVLCMFLALLGIAVFFLVKTGWDQFRLLLENWDGYEAKIMSLFSDLCRKVDKAADMRLGTTYYYCCEKAVEFIEKNESKLTEKVVSLSLPTVRVIGEAAAFVGTVFLSSYFFMTEKYKRARDEKKLHFFMEEEAALLAGKLKEVFGAYLRAQGIIMLCTAFICAVGLAVMKNPYSLILAVVIGFLDALPLIGTGLVFIPWIMIVFLTGNIRSGIILTITYLCCYVLREFLEPKLIGKHAGISPLVTLMTVYIGYGLFGILGVIYGPVAYVLIKGIVELFIKI